MITLNNSLFKQRHAVDSFTHIDRITLPEDSLCPGGKTSEGTDIKISFRPLIMALHLFPKLSIVYLLC